MTLLSILTDTSGGMTHNKYAPERIVLWIPGIKFQVLSLNSRNLLLKSEGKRHSYLWFPAFPTGGYGMDVTKKNKREGTEVTERSKSMMHMSLSK